MIDKQRVLEMLETQLKRPANAHELAAVMELSTEEEQQKLSQVLLELTSSGEVVAIKGGRFGLPDKMNLVVGTLMLQEEGFSSIIPIRAGLAEVSVLPSNMGGALHGDLVVSRVEKRGIDHRSWGRVIRVLKRGRRTLVGRFEHSAQVDYVVPVEPKIQADILITQRGPGNPPTGTFVEAEILHHPTHGRLAQGRLIRILGQSPDPRIDFEVVVKRHCLPEAFSPEAQQAAEEIEKSRITTEAMVARSDFRSQYVLGYKRPQLPWCEEAFHVALKPNGKWRLSIHLPDISYYILENSPLDREARSRGRCYVFPDRVIPMFPESLSASVFPFEVGRDRLTLSTTLEIAENGEVEGLEMCGGIARISDRLEPTSVSTLLAKGEAQEKKAVDTADQLRLLARLSGVLARRRQERGSFDHDLPHSALTMNLEQAFLDSPVRDRSRFLFDEFLVLLNESVANRLEEKGIPVVYRIQGPPRDEGVSSLNQLLRPFGHQVDRLSPETFLNVLEATRGKAEESLVELACTRALRRAQYQMISLGHFSLALSNYVHVTAPARRYLDLVMHRILKQHLLQDKEDQDSETQSARFMDQLAEEASRAEALARTALVDYFQRRKTRRFANKIGATYPALVSGIQTFGLQVELDEGIQGYVRLSSLTDDYYIYDQEEECLRGETTGQSFRLGQCLKVQVTHVNLANQQVEFGLVDAL